MQNVETLAHLALIARRGADWYRQLGSDEEPGSTLVTLAGAVGSPGVYEIELGTPLEFAARGGGRAEGRDRGPSDRRLLRLVVARRAGERCRALKRLASRTRRFAWLRGHRRPARQARARLPRSSASRSTLRPRRPTNAAPACTESGRARPHACMPSRWGARPHGAGADLRRWTEDTCPAAAPATCPTASAASSRRALKTFRQQFEEHARSGP